MLFGVPYAQTNPYVYLYLYKWETAWFKISVVITATTPSGLYTSFAMLWTVMILPSIARLERAGYTERNIFDTKWEWFP